MFDQILKGKIQKGLGSVNSTVFLASSSVVTQSSDTRGEEFRK